MTCAQHTHNRVSFIQCKTISTQSRKKKCNSGSVFFLQNLALLSWTVEFRVTCLAQTLCFERGREREERGKNHHCLLVKMFSEKAEAILYA